MLVCAVAAATLSSCTVMLPVIGETRAATATRSTGIKHESAVAANLLGGLALDAIFGSLLMSLLVVSAYGSSQN